MAVIKRGAEKICNMSYGLMNVDAHNSGCLQPSLKQVGDSAMVWACISAGGVGNLFKNDGIMDTNVAHLFFI